MALVGTCSKTLHPPGQGEPEMLVFITQPSEVYNTDTQSMIFSFWLQCVAMEEPGKS